MADANDVIVEIRNKDLSRAGQVRPVDLNLDATPRFNRPGEWTLRLPATADYPEYADLLTAATAEGSGIIVTHSSGKVLFSGPRRVRDRDMFDNIVLKGVTDDAILWQNLAYADPANNIAGRTTDRDERTGAAETLMYGFVADNIGASAITARKHPNLTAGTDLARGGTTTRSGTHQPLGELLEAMATVASLGFRVVQIADALQFEVYQPSDVSDTVRLDIYNGTLADQRAQQAAPSLTRALVAGQGEGAARTIVEVTTTESVAAETLWGPSFVSERFIDQRQTDDTGELTAKGLEELLASAGGETITLLPSGESTMTFPTDWFLGDIVAVVVDGAEVPATVTSATILASADSGLSYGVGIGEQPGQGLESRVSQLERTVPAVDDTGWLDWGTTPSGVTVGNGTLTQRYRQTGGRVYVEGFLELGSTSGITGEVTLTHPVTASTADSGTFTPLGLGQILDAGAAILPVRVYAHSSTQCRVRAEAVVSSWVRLNPLSASAPITWAAGDQLHWRYAYTPA